MTIMHGFQKALFLREFWQQKPCIIRNFIKDFEDPIDEHDLAGLAQEPGVDSRLISFDDEQWQVSEGPIDDFEPLCKGAWTLLVQGVDKYIDEVDALTEHVKLIPNWRLEDVMISFATKDAGVGPHIDEYDVIIVQGRGERRWQVGNPNDFSQVLPHPLLKQIDAFEPLIDEVLRSGDAIYIPPKYPHNGVAKTDCMNYSIGFRAPTDLELLSGVLDDAQGMSAFQARYSDPEQSILRAQMVHSAQLSSLELDKLTAMMKSLLDAPTSQQAIVQCLSRQHLPDMQPEDTYSLAQVSAALNDIGVLRRSAGVKPLFMAPNELGCVFYIDGNAFFVAEEIQAFTLAFIDTALTQTPTPLSPEQVALFALLCTDLVNAGYWYFSDE
jgi:50S ribosomal protein L16 3-hydroxylase